MMKWSQLRKLRQSRPMGQPRATSQPRRMMGQWEKWAFGLLFLGLANCQSTEEQPVLKKEKVAKESPLEEELLISERAKARLGIALEEVSFKEKTGLQDESFADVQFEPKSTAHVSSLVVGRVKSLWVGLGDEVKEGQLLAVLTSNDILALEVGLQQAETRLSLARNTARRQKDLASEGIGAKRSLTAAESEVRELQAEVNKLRQQLLALDALGGADFELKAPIDGVVVAMHASLGESIGEESAAFTITDPEQIWVQAYVPEMRVKKASVGQRVRVKMQAYPELGWMGTVTYVAPYLDEKTRMMPVRVTLDEGDTRLKKGMFGHVEWLGDENPKEVLAIPYAAVTTWAGGEWVFRALDEGGLRFEAQAVSLGERFLDQVEVLSGLEVGERIAVSSVFALKSLWRQEDMVDDD